VSAALDSRFNAFRPPRPESESRSRVQFAWQRWRQFRCAVRGRPWRLYSAALEKNDPQARA